MIETGWVYVITNESMPGLVKIGVTKNRPEQRAKELDETGCPTPFKVETAFLFSEAAEQVEKQAHALLASFRVRGNREFFKCLPWLAAEKVLDAADILNSVVLTNEPVYLSQQDLLLREEEKKQEREEEDARQLLKWEEEKAAEARKRKAKKLKEALRLEEQKLQQARWQEQSDIENAINKAEISLPIERLKKKLDSNLEYFLYWIFVYLVGLIIHISILFNHGLSGFNWQIFVGHTLATLIVCRLFFIRWMRLKTQLRQAINDYSDSVSSIRKRLTDSPSRSEKTG